MTRDELIIAWDGAKKELARLKEAEMSFRNQIIALDFANHKIEGTETVDLGSGYKLKAVFKNTYSFKDKDLIDAALSKIEALDAEGEYIAERLIKFKPELSVSEYKKLDSRYFDIINEVIITKPATPSLELVIPKDI